MTSIIFFFIFIPILGAILLSVNFILAPHNPYKEKKTPFECGYHSFLSQNRTQFTISFFIFALLFLTFDLELVLVYPYGVSSYNNGVYGLVVVVIFILILSLGFVFELGKKALRIDTMQDKNIQNNDNNTLYSSVLLKPISFKFSKFKTLSSSPSLLLITTSVRLFSSTSLLLTDNEHEVVVKAKKELPQLEEELRTKNNECITEIATLGRLDHHMRDLVLEDSIDTSPETRAALDPVYQEHREKKAQLDWEARQHLLEGDRVSAALALEQAGNVQGEFNKAAYDLVYGGDNSTMPGPHKKEYDHWDMYRPKIDSHASSSVTSYVNAAYEVHNAKRMIDMFSEEGLARDFNHARDVANELLKLRDASDKEEAEKIKAEQEEIKAIVDRLLQEQVAKDVNASRIEQNSSNQTESSKNSTSASNESKPENKGSLIDDFADVNLEQPSYMDPED